MDKYRQERCQYFTHSFAKHFAEFRPQCNMLLLCQGMPRPVEMVHTVGISRYLEFKCPRVLRAKIVHGQDFKIRSLQLAGKDCRQCRCIHIAVIVNEIMTFIIFHNSFQERESLLRTEGRGFNRIPILNSVRSMLPSKEVWSIQQVIERFQYFHVTIEVDATIVVERL